MFLKALFSKFATKLNLQLFADGGGASAGASGTGASADGVSEGAGENSFSALGIPDKAKHIVDKMPKMAKQTTAENVAEPTGKESASTSESVDTNSRRSFEELVKSDEYASEAKDYMNKTFAKRMSKYKGLEAENARMREILDMQNLRYGLDSASSSYLDDYKSAVENDTKLYEDAALDAGLTVEQYMQVKRAEQVIKQNEADTRAREANEMVQKHISNLVEQAEALKKKYPSFNLENELANPKFRQLVDTAEFGGSGVPVETAFLVVHHDEIMQSTIANAVEQANIATANAVHANRNRAVEGGLSNAQTATTYEDVSKYTLDDFKKIRENYKRNGVRPRFN